MLLSYLRHDLAQVLLALRDQLLQQAFELGPVHRQLHRLACRNDVVTLF